MVRRIRPILLVVLALIAASAGAAPSPADEIPAGSATNWILGHRLLRDGDIKGALPYLHLAYRADPDQPLIALDFQRALAAEGYLADAIGVMNRLVEAHPDSASWRLRRSGLNIRAGNVDEALGDLRELRRRGDISLDVLATEAAIHMRQGRVGAALDAYRDGLYILPDRRADIFLGMVDILQQSGENGRIPETLEEGLAAEPTNPGLWLSYVRTLAVLGRHDEAMAAAEKADLEVLPLRPDPDAGPDEFDESLPFTPPPPRSRGMTPAAERWPAESFRVELADVYARTGDLERAVAVLESLEEGGSLGLQASLWLGRMLIGTGRHEEASVQIAKILDQWPESGRGHFLRGKLAESRNDWAGAIDEYREAARRDDRDPEIGIALVRAMLVSWERHLSEDPVRREDLHVVSMQASTRVDNGDAPSQLVLGYAFRAAGDNERAAWRFGLAAEEPGLRLTALIQQSICHDDMGQPNEARRVLEVLRRELPENAEVANSLGYFLAEKDEDLELAEELVQEALATEPNNGAYLDSLGWVYYRLGRFDDAFDYLVRAVNVLPEDPVILEHLGLTLLAMGQDEEARSTLERAVVAGGDRDHLTVLIESIGKDGP